MANNKIYVKRTSTSGRTPNTTNSGNSQYIAAGELALNMADGILYSSNGSASIEIGANNTIARVTGNLTVNAIIANGSIGSANQVLTSNGSSTYWSTVTGGSGGTTTRVYQTYTAADGQTDFAVTGGYSVGYVDVFYNGVHLSNSEFTETGLVVSLVSGANAGAIVEVSGFLLAGTPGVGSNTEIYFNDSTVQSTNNLFTFNKTSTTVTVGNSSVNTQITPGNVFLNGSKLIVGNTSTNVTINASAIAFGTTGNITGTSYSGTSNNSTYAFGKTEGNLNVNNALTANSASYLGSTLAAAYVQNTDTRILSGNLNFTGTNTYFTSGLYANTITTVSNSGILLAPARAPTFAEGLIYYDTTDKSLTVYNDYNGFTLPVGQKEFVRVWNQSGATIAKGKPVYISGTHGTHYHPMIDLASANSATTYDVLGLAAHDIANSTHGYVITRGWVGGFDTSGLTAGQRVHLGFSAAGSLVTTAPQYPNYPMDIGYCLNSDASNGHIYVDLVPHTLEQLRVINDGYFGGDLTVAGDLNITGNVYSVSAATLSTSENIVYLASGDTITTVTFTGSGLNDATFRGVFEGLSSTTYYVKIDGTGTPDTFAWSKNDFSTTIASGIAITGANQLLDNGIYVKFNATTGHTLNNKWSGVAAPVNVDLGWGGNYNDGSNYAHAGFFRDATDGYFKVFDGYEPEFSSNVNIDTTNSSFTIAKFWTDAIRIGNTGTYATINSSSYSGDANNASFLGGVSPSAYVNTSGNYTLSGVITHTANLVTNTIFASSQIYSGPNTVGFNFGTTAVFEGKGNVNTFIEINMQNGNTGTAASSDLVATADSGNDSVNFVDLGINSSTYNQAGFNIIGALDAYLYASNGHLAIGTASEKDVIFHAGGTTSANRIMTVNSTAVTISNTEPLNVNTVNSIGTVNAVTISTGTNFVANSTLVTISGTPLSANGSNGTSGQVLTSNGSTGSPYWKTEQATILFIIDGGSAAITTGEKGELEIPFNCTINSWTLIADQTGSIVVDIWKDTYANAPPTVADTITAAAKPTLSSAIKNQSSTLTGWTTTLNAGDILTFNVDSVTTVTRVSLNLRVTKT